MTDTTFSVLKANLYGALPNRSGSVMVLHAATGLIAGLLPFLLGVVADQIGLSPTVKLLSVAPLVIFVLARLEKRRENSSTVSRNG